MRPAGRDKRTSTLLLRKCTAYWKPCGRCVCGHLRTPMRFRAGCHQARRTDHPLKCFRYGLGHALDEAKIRSSFFCARASKSCMLGGDASAYSARHASECCHPFPSPWPMQYRIPDAAPEPGKSHPPFSSRASVIFPISPYCARMCAISLSSCPSPTARRAACVVLAGG